MNLHYIRTQAKRYTSGQYNANECLYHIGLHTSVLTVADRNLMQGGQLTSKMRSRVLTWLRRNANQIGLTVEE